MSDTTANLSVGIDTTPALESLKALRAHMEAVPHTLLINFEQSKIDTDVQRAISQKTYYARVNTKAVYDSVFEAVDKALDHAFTKERQLNWNVAALRGGLSAAINPVFADRERRLFYDRERLSGDIHTVLTTAFESQHSVDIDKARLTNQVREAIIAGLQAAPALKTPSRVVKPQEPEIHPDVISTQATVTGLNTVNLTAELSQAIDAIFAREHVLRIDVRTLQTQVGAALETAFATVHKVGVDATAVRSTISEALTVAFAAPRAVALDAAPLRAGVERAVAEAMAAPHQLQIDETALRAQIERTVVSAVAIPARIAVDESRLRAELTQTINAVFEPKHSLDIDEQRLRVSVARALDAEFAKTHELLVDSGELRSSLEQALEQAFVRVRAVNFSGAGLKTEIDAVLEQAFLGKQSLGVNETDLINRIRTALALAFETRQNIVINGADLERDLIARLNQSFAAPHSVTVEDGKLRAELIEEITAAFSRNPTITPDVVQMRTTIEAALTAEFERVHRINADVARLTTDLKVARDAAFAEAIRVRVDTATLRADLAKAQKDGLSARQRLEVDVSSVTAQITAAIEAAFVKNHEIHIDAALLTSHVKEAIAAGIANPPPLLVETRTEQPRTQAVSTDATVRVNTAVISSELAAAIDATFNRDHTLRLDLSGIKAQIVSTIEAAFDAIYKVKVDSSGIAASLTEAINEAFAAPRHVVADLTELRASIQAVLSKPYQVAIDSSAIRAEIERAVYGVALTIKPTLEVDASRVRATIAAAIDGAFTQVQQVHLDDASITLRIKEAIARGFGVTEPLNVPTRVIQTVEHTETQAEVVAQAKVSVNTTELATAISKVFETEHQIRLDLGGLRTQIAALLDESFAGTHKLKLDTPALTAQVKEAIAVGLGGTSSVNVQTHLVQSELREPAPQTQIVNTIANVNTAGLSAAIEAAFTVERKVLVNLGDIRTRITAALDEGFAATHQLKVDASPITARIKEAIAAGLAGSPTITVQARLTQPEIAQPAPLSQVVNAVVQANTSELTGKLSAAIESVFAVPRSIALNLSDVRTRIATALSEGFAATHQLSVDTAALIARIKDAIAVGFTGVAPLNVQTHLVQGELAEPAPLTQTVKSIATIDTAGLSAAIQNVFSVERSIPLNLGAVRTQIATAIDEGFAATHQLKVDASSLTTRIKEAITAGLVGAPTLTVQTHLVQSELAQPAPQTQVITAVTQINTAGLSEKLSAAIESVFAIEHVVRVNVLSMQAEIAKALDASFVTPHSLAVNTGTASASIDKALEKIEVPRVVTVTLTDLQSGIERNIDQAVAAPRRINIDEAALRAEIERTITSATVIPARIELDESRLRAELTATVNSALSPSHEIDIDEQRLRISAARALDEVFAKARELTLDAAELRTTLERALEESFARTRSVAFNGASLKAEVEAALQQSFAGRETVDVNVSDLIAHVRTALVSAFETRENISIDGAELQRDLVSRLNAVFATTHAIKADSERLRQDLSESIAAAFVRTPTLKVDTAQMRDVIEGALDAEFARVHTVNADAARLTATLIAARDAAFVEAVRVRVDGAALRRDVSEALAAAESAPHKLLADTAGLRSELAAALDAAFGRAYTVQIDAARLTERVREAVAAGLTGGTVKVGLTGAAPRAPEAVAAAAALAPVAAPAPAVLAPNLVATLIRTLTPAVDELVKAAALVANVARKTGIQQEGGGGQLSASRSISSKDVDTGFTTTVREKLPTPELQLAGIQVDRRSKAETEAETSAAKSEADFRAAMVNQRLVEIGKSEAEQLADQIKFDNARSAVQTALTDQRLTEIGRSEAAAAAAEAKFEAAKVATQTALADQRLAEIGKSEAAAAAADKKFQAAKLSTQTALDDQRIAEIGKAEAEALAADRKFEAAKLATSAALNNQRIAEIGRSEAEAAKAEARRVASISAFETAIQDQKQKEIGAAEIAAARAQRDSLVAYLARTQHELEAIYKTPGAQIASVQAAAANPSFGREQVSEVIGPKKSFQLDIQPAELDSYRKIVEGVEGSITKTSAAHGALAKTMADVRGAARGLGGEMGALWATYGSIVPLVAAAAIGGALKSIFTVGKDVEYQLAFVSALSDDAAVSVDKFYEALKGGLIAPKEAAEAMRGLAQNGLSVKESLQVLPQILSLATAGELSLTEASLGATGVMAAFGLSVNDLGRVSDVFTKAAAISNTSVHGMVESMKQASVVGDDFHITLEETAAALAVLAQRNITNTQAGTSLRNMIQELYTPTKKAREALAQMGVTLVDGNKQFVSFEEAIKRIRDATLGLDEASRGAFLEDVFNKKGDKAISALVNNIGDFKEKLREVTDESKNFAQGVTDALGETTQGKIKKLFSEFEVAADHAFDSAKSSAGGFFDQLRILVATPEFSEGLKGIIDGIVSLTRFLEDNAKTILITAGAWAAFRVLGSVIEGFTALRIAMAAAQAGAVTFGAAASSALGFATGGLSIVVALAAEYLLLRDNTDASTQALRAHTAQQEIANSESDARIKKMMTENDVLERQVILQRQGLSAAAAKKQAEGELVTNASLKTGLTVTQNEFELDNVRARLKSLQETPVQYFEGIPVSDPTNDIKKLKELASNLEKDIAAGKKQIADAKTLLSESGRREGASASSSLLDEARKFNEDLSSRKNLKGGGQITVEPLSIEFLNSPSNDQILAELKKRKTELNTELGSYTPKDHNPIPRQLDKAEVRDAIQDIHDEEAALKQYQKFRADLDNAKYNPTLFGPQATAILAEQREIGDTTAALKLQTDVVERLRALKNLPNLTDPDKKAIDTDVKREQAKLNLQIQDNQNKAAIAQARADAKAQEEANKADKTQAELSAKSLQYNIEITRTYSTKIENPGDALAAKASDAITKEYSPTIVGYQQELNNGRALENALIAERLRLTGTGTPLASPEIDTINVAIDAIHKKQDVDQTRLISAQQNMTAEAKSSADLAKQLYDQSQTAEYGWDKFWQTFQDNASSSAKIVGDVMKVTTDGISKNITDSITKGKADWKGLADSILQTVTKLLVDQQLAQFMKFLGVSPISGSSKGGTNLSADLPDNPLRSSSPDSSGESAATGLGSILSLFKNNKSINQLSEGWFGQGGALSSNYSVNSPDWLNQLKGGNWGSLFGGGASSAAAGAGGTLGDFGNLTTVTTDAGATLFAHGGIMTSDGPMQLNKYSAGGIAHGPQIEEFGESTLPEANVPLQDGRTIPVTINDKGGAAKQSIHLSYSPVIHIDSRSDQAQIAQLVGASVTEGNRQLVQHLKDTGAIA